MSSSIPPSQVPTDTRPKPEFPARVHPVLLDPNSAASESGDIRTLFSSTATLTMKLCSWTQTYTKHSAVEKTRLPTSHDLVSPGSSSKSSSPKKLGCSSSWLMKA